MTPAKSWKPRPRWRMALSLKLKFEESLANWPSNAATWNKPSVVLKMHFEVWADSYLAIGPCSACSSCAKHLFKLYTRHCHACLFTGADVNRMITSDLLCDC